MDQEYSKRGQRVTIRELAEVIAVKPQADRRGEDDIARIGRRADIAAESPLGRAQPAFEADGWVFLVAADVRDAVNQRRPPDGTDSIQRVFEEASGQIVLGLDRLDVRFATGVTTEEARRLLAAAHVEVIRQFTFADNLFHVRVPPDQDFLEVSRRLSEQPDVVYAEPVFIEEVPARFAGVDPSYGLQWHLKNTGQDGGTPGADIRAEDAWCAKTGHGVRIAIVDHGFETDHPDLQAAVNHQVSGAFLAAADPAEPAVFVQNPAQITNDNHGTFCAGIALARAFNNTGGRGVAYEADFIAVATTHEATGTQETLARAIAYAASPATEGVAHPGADVISCSLGPGQMRTVLRDAIDFAVTMGRNTLGVPIFWAVDNQAVSITLDEVCSYANTIAVGCSTRHDVAGVCAFGAELAFLACGVDVFSTASGKGYDTADGTSFAAPLAAGIAALLIEKKGTATWQQVRDAIRDGCDPIGGVAYVAGHHDTYGAGRVNAAKALTKIA
ncbi:MAG: S8 family serine peptidase [Thermomicrobiales bacterium]